MITRVLTILSIVQIAVLSYDYQGYDICNKQPNCSACISHNPTCMWCSDEGVKIDNRCRAKSGECESLIIPEGDTVAKAIPGKDEEIGVTLEDDSIVQIKPQALAASVRNGSSVTFNVIVSPAKDFPLDLYFVMDHSFSMEPTLQTLKSSVDAMSQKLKQLTNNHRIGFGTFVDKTTAPYIYTTDARKKNPCFSRDSDNVCPPAYNFNNTVSLNEFEEFNALIKSSQVSASVDLPEAGMDALMQVAACKTQIGWRDHSRKVVVYLTDTGFHFAGDGKLGGQVERNDGNCWLEDGRTYSKEKILDYPSIHQVVKKMVAQQMIPIFGVTEKVIKLYKELQKFFPYGSVGLLQEDSENLVDLIYKEYASISSTIVPRQTETVSGIKMDYIAKCPGSEVGVQNGECGNVGIEQHAEFEFTVTAEQCLENTKELIIEFTGFGQLKLDLSTLCDCDCDKNVTQNADPDVCSGKGDPQCGGCVCDKGWSGDVCDCPDGEKGDVLQCKAGGILSSLTCSGTQKGKCRCGECDCTPPNYGTHCQCNDEGRNCDCSGHGKCACPAGATQSVCVCDEGWTGPQCSCTTDTTDCKFDGVDCAGNGVCECGKCKCNTDTRGNTYSGKYCQACEFCKMCEEFEECVLCAVGSDEVTGKDSQDCDSCDVAAEVFFTSEHYPEDYNMDDDVNDKNQTKWCRFEKDECTYEYYYTAANETRQTRRLLYINNDPDCGPVNIIYIIVGVMAAIICMGIIVICCWKCAVSVKDKQEYKKFIEDMENAKFAETQSPLYNCPITHVNNPIAKKM